MQVLQLTVGRDKSNRWRDSSGRDDKGRDESSRQSRKHSHRQYRSSSSERYHRRHYTSSSSSYDTSSSEEREREKRHKHRGDRRFKHQAYRDERSPHSASRGRDPLIVQAGATNLRAGRPPAPPTSRGSTVGIVAEELPTLKLDPFTWEPLEVDSIGLSHRVAKCIGRLFPDWVLWADVKGDAIKYQTLLNDIMAGFANGHSISYRLIKDKIVTYLRDRRYCWKERMKGTWNSENLNYTKPPGMTENTFKFILPELNAEEDTAAHKRLHKADNARASKPAKKVTNYWGQGVVKRFLATFVRSFSLKLSIDDLGY
jgi:hypothetical protein